MMNAETIDPAIVALWLDIDLTDDVAAESCRFWHRSTGDDLTPAELDCMGAASRAELDAAESLLDAEQSLNASDAMGGR
jgi:hypothetical protein